MTDRRFRLFAIFMFMLMGAMVMVGLAHGYDVRLLCECEPEINPPTDACITHCTGDVNPADPKPSAVDMVSNCVDECGTVFKTRGATFYKCLDLCIDMTLEDECRYH